jgi:2-keto-3-deoxy-L-rhamnonate aldolase RhmA
MPEQESLKQRIHHGDIILGVSVPIQIDRSRLETILSQDAYDFVAVDSQHILYAAFDKTFFFVPVETSCCSPTTATFWNV